MLLRCLISFFIKSSFFHYYAIFIILLDYVLKYYKIYKILYLAYLISILSYNKYIISSYINLLFLFLLY